MSFSTSFYLDNIISYHRPDYRMAHSHSSPARTNYVYMGNPGYTYHAPARQTHVHVNDVNMMREMRRNDQEDRDRSRENSAALLGAIATIVFAGLSALGGRFYSNSKKELVNAIEFRDTLPRLQLERGIKDDLTLINNKHIDILQEKLDFSKNVMMLTGGVLGCSAAAFLGGMFSVSALITASVVGAVGFTAIGTFSTVWYLTGDNALPTRMIDRVQEIRKGLT